MKTEHVYLMTVGTGTQTKQGTSDVMHGIATSLARSEPPPDTFYLVPSSAPDSKAAADIVLEYAQELGIADRFRRKSEAEPFFCVESPDELGECRADLFRILREVKNRHPGCALHVNPTSGTKPMTTAAVLAALDHGGTELQYTTGQRIDGVVATGTETLSRVSTDDFFELRAIRDSLLLYTEGSWEGGRSLLAPYVRNTRFPCASLLHMLGTLLSAWDRLQYRLAEKALNELRDHPARAETDAEHADARRYAEAVIASAQDVLPAYHAAGEKKAQFRMGDLLANARRRIDGARYDDAVARLYRLIEMSGRYLLRHKFGVDLDNPASALSALQALAGGHRLHWLEERLRQRKGKETLVLGVVDLFRIFKEIEPDAWALYHDAGLQALLEKRNHSVLAHGFEPIDETTARKLEAAATRFLEAFHPEVADWAARCRFPSPFPAKENP